MNEMAALRQMTKSAVVDYQQLSGLLSRYGKSRDKVQRPLASENIVRVKKGLYVFGDLHRRAPVGRELLANLIYGPSYVSLDYALSYHGLTPERVEAVTSITTGRSRKFQTPFGVFFYRGASEKRYATGAVIEHVHGVSFLIASPEKSLVDKVWADKRFSGTRLSDFGPCLTEDLRRERYDLLSPDATRLAGSGKAYDSPKIRLLLRYLSSLRENSDAWCNSRHAQPIRLPDCR
ncbi:MAG: hypothetical protein GW893_21705 [Armatimonadetes bacterium]|nr:hypothetical protein [Armatimonadota bacterium]PIU62457.1 MAG: hypothetical protein COS85_18495 [Armatimonadetes bacterium CG07_land_8_20_14_0_80_59_28]PIX44248.1 MAG: hypothetical protein COZ56_04975 [Armatimonadetes bacterium CG_4_8_14_3_um_filter_58_9]PIY42236.1 MAG: hypothetical protein COZ05_14245 [Armatimonadetes bacterium CG_4_10_14_3_um_filter_59_10]PJB76019.1 MAG: hypothetical protein CO095_03050 [Armatimonadetes bacterium CG_4_9_14_3_um_filter_58_7]